MFLLETFLINIYNVLILRFTTNRNLGTQITAVTTLLWNLFAVLWFYIDPSINEFSNIKIIISKPRVFFLDYGIMSPVINSNGISRFSTFPHTLDFVSRGPRAEFSFYDSYYQCQPSLLIDTTLLPKSYICWPTEEFALLDEKRCKFHANIVNITQWRGNPLCVVTPSHAIGGTIIDIFVCTSPEYFYAFRIEYFVQNTTSSTLEKLIPPVTEELLQTVRLQVPPKSGKLFYTSDRLLSLFFNGINSLRGLRSLEGDAIVEALFFSYTPMLPFLFNLATMYIPYDIV